MSVTRRAYRVLGQQLYTVCIGIRGAINERKAESLSRELVPMTSLTEGFGNATFRYTEEDEGFTHIRCLVDSFIVIDSWHPAVEGAYIFIHAYWQIDPGNIVDQIKGLGYEVKCVETKVLGI